MQTHTGAHADDETLERYSIGKLAEPELGRLEEHLLLCPQCKERAEAVDQFLVSFRNVAPRFPLEHRGPESPAWWHVFRRPAVPRLAIAGALAVLVLAFVVGRTWIGKPAMDLAPATVFLQLSRGPAATSAANAPSGRPLVLEAELTELAALQAYRVAVVSSGGERLFSASAQPREGRLRVVVPKALAKGLYFVQVFSPDGEELREFSLNVR